jgi:hypothetical protein
VATKKQIYDRKKDEAIAALGYLRNEFTATGVTHFCLTDVEKIIDKVISVWEERSMSARTFLKDLKVGDRVLIRHHYRNGVSDWREATFTRLCGVGCDVMEFENASAIVYFTRNATELCNGDCEIKPSEQGEG